MIVGRSHISIVKDTRRTMSNHASGASAPKLNTWIVVIQIFALLIAVFLIERHLRKVEHRSRSATFAYQITLPAPSTKHPKNQNLGRCKMLSPKAELRWYARTPCGQGLVA